MKHRLCLPELTEREAMTPGATVTLSREQAHYLGRVLRLKPGAEFGLFDGAGNEWPAELAELSNRAATAIIRGTSDPDSTPVPLVLVASWLKGSAMDTVVQKSVELGATAIWLLDAARSTYKADAKRRGNKLAHLERVGLLLLVSLLARALLLPLGHPRVGRKLSRLLLLRRKAAWISTLHNLPVYELFDFGLDRVDASLAKHL